jgi:hypothetical protein
MDPVVIIHKEEIKRLTLALNGALNWHSVALDEGLSGFDEGDQMDDEEAVSVIEALIARLEEAS